MANIRISDIQAATLLKARTASAYERKSIKRRIWSELRAKYGIPSSIKFKVAIEAPDNPLYCVLRNKHTNVALTDGAAEPVATPVALATSPATVSAAEPVAAQTPS